MELDLCFEGVVWPLMQSVPLMWFVYTVCGIVTGYASPSLWLRTGT